MVWQLTGQPATQTGKNSLSLSGFGCWPVVTSVDLIVLVNVVDRGSWSSWDEMMRCESDLANLQYYYANGFWRVVPHLTVSDCGQGSAFYSVEIQFNGEIQTVKLWCAHPQPTPIPPKTSLAAPNRHFTLIDWLIDLSAVSLRQKKEKVAWMMPIKCKWNYWYFLNRMMKVIELNVNVQIANIDNQRPGTVLDLRVLFLYSRAAFFLYLAFSYSPICQLIEFWIEIQWQGDTISFSRPFSGRRRRPINCPQGIVNLITR